MRGRDIKRYSYEFANLYLISTFPSLKIDIKQYPAVKNFLEGFKPKLKQTGELLTDLEKEQVLRHAKEQGIDVSESDLKKSRKKTNNKWFETQDSISYWEDFSIQKIIYPNMTKFLPFILDNKGFFTNQKCFILTGECISFLVAFFNSSLFKFCFRDNFPELQGGTRELSKIFFEKIPIIRVSDEVDSIFRNKVIEIKNNLSNGIDTKHLDLEIDEMIFDLYSLTKDEKDVVGFIEIQ